jgi:Bax protein
LSLSFASGKKQVKLTQRGKAFIEKFVPIIYKENSDILEKRSRILGIREYFYYTGNLSVENRNFLIRTANEYDFTDYKVMSYTYREDLLAATDQLLERVDMIPVRMILAQAIIETAWGKSSAAQATNNYFGLTCRCGGGRLVTSSGTTNYYLKPYDTLEEGIADYMHLLNTKRSYAKFRDLRSECRKNDLPLRDEVLTAGLLKYSELGEVYIAKINHVIRKYLRNDNVLASLDVKP